MIKAVLRRIYYSYLEWFYHRLRIIGDKLCEIIINKKIDQFCLFFLYSMMLWMKFTSIEQRNRFRWT